ncbi:unnamed protein product [Gongylonema pulchrum]|uniref:Uncharacterized protein n=1 Tax=Gongylonema pulchrum TaxID=637853 RepID=A0A3P7NRG4_9BILA|nr:unnamed protein product [Gongylonema pulchrum]
MDKLLPKKTKEELEAIARDNSLAPDKKYVKFHDVFNELDAEIKEKLPLPPMYAGLHDETKTKIRAIFREKTSFDEKQEKLENLYQTLSEEEKKLAPEWGEIRR